MVRNTGRIPCWRLSPNTDNIGRGASSRAPGNTTRADNATPFTASPSLTRELDRQLEEWRLWLPTALQFPDRTLKIDQDIGTLDPWSPRRTADRLRGHLMARYYAAKSIIHRQFLFRTLHSEDNANLRELDLTGARTALCAGFLSIVHGGMSHEPLPLLLHPMNSWKA